LLLSDDNRKTVHSIFVARQLAHSVFVPYVLCRLLTPLASIPEQSWAAWRVHAVFIPWQSRCCSQPSTFTRWYHYV